MQATGELPYFEPFGFTTKDANSITSQGVLTLYWKLDRFWELLNIFPVGRSLNHPIESNDGRFAFELSVYPHGRRETCADYVGVRVRLTKMPDDCQAACSVSIMMERGDVLVDCRQPENTKWLSGGAQFFYDNLIARNLLLEHPDEYIPGMYGPITFDLV